MSKRNGLSGNIFPWLLTLLGGALLLLLYWSTNFSSITWWVGSEYPLMAVCLGVAPAPGSLILTLIGWLATKIPFGLTQAVVLNGLAGLLAVITVWLTLLVSRRVLTDQQDEIASGSESGVKHLAMLSAILLLGVSGTVWRHALMFQPYILIALFTGLILIAMIHWWNVAETEASHRWLFIVLLLFGLDFSVHRTNLLLLPGLIAWVLLRYPKTALTLRSWLAGVIGLVLGLCFQFVTMLLASFKPAFNADNATNLTSFYNYISLKQAGGGWLLNLYPRNAEFFSVQLPDYWRIMVDNLFVTDGPLGYFGLLTVLLLLLGVLAIIRTNYKLCLGLVILFLCSSLGGVLYFNTPANYYWPMDRHYLPSLVILTLFIAVGAGRLALAAWSSTKLSKLFTVLVLAVLLALPVNSYMRNLPEVDASRRHFAYDYATNILNNIEPNAIVIVQGDVLWPLLYLHVAENLRPDVTLLSESLLNTRWYPEQVKQLDPNLPLTLEADDYNIRPWRDTTISITVAESNVDSTVTVEVNVPPTVAEKYLMVQDWLLIKMLQENQFRRPVYLTSPSMWLMPLLQPEGFPWKIVPTQEPETNNRILADNLLKNYRIRGFDDMSLPLDHSSMMVGEQLYRAHLSLTRSLIEAASINGAKEVLAHLNLTIPPGRLDSYAEWQPALTALEEMIRQASQPDSLPETTE